MSRFMLTRPRGALVSSVDSNHTLTPRLLTIFPLTRTRPSRIICSHCRRESIPEWLRNFCSRSSPLNAKASGGGSLRPPRPLPPLRPPPRPRPPPPPPAMAIDNLHRSASAIIEVATMCGIGMGVCRRQVRYLHVAAPPSSKLKYCRNMLGRKITDSKHGIDIWTFFHDENLICC